jgi:predicted TIM-barrel fold metal-dependent hydrolase
MPEPVAVPKKPRFAPPPRACDAHCHVFGPASAHRYATPERLLALHRHLGIERCVIVQAGADGADAMFAAIEASGGRYRGVALANDSVTDKDLRALHERGVRGVRFTFVAHLGGAPDLGMMQRVIDRIAPLGWHVTLLLDPADIVRHADLVRAIRVPFVIDHMGRVPADQGVHQPAFATLLELMRCENAWVKVSGPDRVSTAGAPFYDAVPYAQALLAAAPDRVLWGTDWPHPNIPHVPDDGDLVDLVPLIAPDPAVRRKLLVDNPARLYGFPA